MEIEKLTRRHIGIPISLLILYVLIAASVGFEYFSGYTPSVLCLFERYCLLTTVLLVTFAYFCSSFYQRIISQTCVLLFFTAIITAYHVLIQHEMLPEPDFCRTAIPNDVSVKEMEEIIRKNAASSCANVSMSFFGVSLDTIILAGSLFLFTYLSVIVRQDSDKESN